MAAFPNDVSLFMPRDEHRRGSCGANVVLVLFLSAGRAGSSSAFQKLCKAIEKILHPGN
jgi:hypothetical protein